MDNNTSNATPSRIHPLIATAAVSVIAASLAGVAAITGILPGSHSSTTNAAMAPVSSASTQAPSAVAPLAVAPATTQPAATVSSTTSTTAPVAARHTPVHHSHVASRPADTTYSQNYPSNSTYSSNPNYSSNPTYSSSPVYQPAPVYAPQQPTAAVQQNSPIGIGLGAVIGGLAGNQVGGGNGKTLATVAGALGGAYIGNEVAKRNGTGN